MTGRFVIRPILGIAAVLSVVGTAVLSADTDSLTPEQVQAILYAFDEKPDAATTSVDALDANTTNMVRAAFEGDMFPALTFAAAQTTGVAADKTEVAVEE